MEYTAMIKKTEDTFEKYAIHIRTLYQLKEFPMNLWKAMAEIGLLGFNIPKQYGGLGFSNKKLLQLFEYLTEKGFPLGLVLSWLTHLGLANFLILPFAKEEEKQGLLSQMAKGEITISLAYGELGSGGSPKRLKTNAIACNDYFIINGKKDFITNGNLADIFAVFPVTGEKEGVKEISVFLVPKDHKGVEIKEPIDVRRLNPALHCSVVFKDCLVKAEDRIGDEGKAYDQILKPWREYEDIYLMGALIGAMHRQLGLVMEQTTGLSDSMDFSRIEELFSMYQSYKVLITESVSMLDNRIHNEKLSSLILSARRIAVQFQNVYSDTILEYEMKEDEEMRHVTGSIYDLLKIAEGTFPTRRTKLGKNLIDLMDQRKGSLG
ncbi:MAG: acyl-CoA dehydrogenase family protein [Peptostreptococcales bacterium]